MNNRPTKVIHYYARFGEHRSGVTESIATWLRIASAEYPTELWMAPLRHRVVHRDLRVVRGLDTEISEVPHLGRRRPTYLPLLPWWRIRRGDIFVVHEGWVLSNTVAVAIARARGAVCIGVPHGVYEPQLTETMRDLLGVRRLVERMTLRGLDRLHVFYSSEAELAEAVAGRGIPSGAFPNPAPPVAPTAAWNRDGADDYYLWLGRFDVKHKGLDRLVELWATLDAPRPRLVLAGPDVDGGKAVVRGLIEKLGLRGTVSMRDSVDGAEKAELIRRAAGYVHPSRWESCSMILNEMVAVGVPSLVTEGIHAAEPMRRAGVVTTYADSTSFRAGLTRLRGSGVGGQPQRERALAFSEAVVGDSYRRWLRETIVERGDR
ncbi:glycosyltransferase [Raineyella sp.]|nr:glycosyltransferase [Raineyella sp.]MEA5153340.1 glycosyltransferase [Raineyella sp.]